MRTRTSISRKDTRMYLKNNVKMITRIDDLHDHLCLAAHRSREFFKVPEKRGYSEQCLLALYIFLTSYSFRGL